MIIKNFIYDGKDYFVEFNNHTSFSFYIKNYDYVYDDEDSSEVTNNTKNPIKLLRKIEKIIKDYIYKNKIAYFTFVVEGTKRVKIYKRFADSLDGYSYIIKSNEYGSEFYFTKNVD